MVTKWTEKLARGVAEIDMQHKEFIRRPDAVPPRIAWRTLMSWPHFGLTTFALVSLLLMSQGRAQAQLIHEHADWPALTNATSPCKSFPFTVTGPGRLTIRLKMNPYYRRSFTNRGENIVQAEALPYIATGKGTTINGLPNQDDTLWFGKPVDMISTWEFGGGKRSAEVVFCPAIMCHHSDCSQRAATAELIVDWTDGNTAPAGNESVPFNSMNDYGVGNGPTVPAKFTLSQPHLITSIMTYHWNNGRGTRVGTIGLKDAAGRIYGPWPVKGSPGQGGVPNVNWTATPNVKLPAGAYTIIDSEPSTWSQNAQSRGRGLGLVKGYPINSTPQPTPAGNAGVTESTGANLAKNRPAKQSSIYTGSKSSGAQGAVDGVKNGEFGFHTQSEPNPWWQVDLGEVKSLTEIRIFNRLDCCPERARTIQIVLSNDGTNWTRVFTNNGSAFGGSDGKPLKVSLKESSARYVRLQLAETNYFHLDEVEIY